MTDEADIAFFEDVAHRTVARFPEAIRKPAREVAILVTDWPTDAMLKDLGLAARFDLTGLYDGIPLTEKSVWDTPAAPDCVWLFRQPILREWRDRGNIGLEQLIAHVTVHEFAHHFGWSDADIARIDQWWE